MTTVPTETVLTKTALTKTGLTKYDELGLKTDKQLMRLAEGELDLGICYAQRALKAADSPAITEFYYLTAKNACAKAAWLLSLARETRKENAFRLELLREMLEALSAIGAKPVPTEDDIATLARAMWRTRGCPEGSPEEDWFRAERALKPQPACVAH